MKMELNRMSGPVAAPVVVQINLNRLILLIDAVSKEFLDARILGEGNVRTKVKQKARFVTEGRGMAAMVAILVVHRGGNALGMQLVSRTKPGHSSSEHDYVWVCH